MKDELSEGHEKDHDFNDSSEPNPPSQEDAPAQSAGDVEQIKINSHNEPIYRSIEKTYDGKEIPYDSRNYTHNIVGRVDGTQFREPAYSEARTGEGPGAPPVTTGSPYTGYEVISRPERAASQLSSPLPRDRGPGLVLTLALVLLGAILGSAITMGVGWGLLNESGIIRGSQSGTTLPGRSSQNPGLTISVNTRPPGAATAENLVAEKVTPSVVGITTRMENPESAFFAQGNGTIQGVGSGVIVSSDGYILTNSHVVDGGEAWELKVILSDGTIAEGEVIWSDDALDLAMVSIDEADLTPVELGTAQGLQVGDKAIAIGNPLGMNLQSTLTSGYISGLDRAITIQDGGSMTGLIQTDAAINAGNSGGALLNEAGQLVGINTAKAGGTASGIGFAIPIDTAVPVIQRIMAEGTFENVYMGISGTDLSLVKAREPSITYEGAEGVYVMEVMAGTAAEEAGLRRDDIIIAIDGKAVASMTDMKRELLSYGLGDTVTVTYIRANREGRTELTFAQDSSTIDQFASTQPAAAE